ncbi:hypothetical protein CROQUDRAFT_416624 [Cronartium quercuum f. sp. fusiforme G11]|uniref:Uncharacterized protein n=1 Tax=Cronartium quercuum f. sp. fusiforme G11 TaxID=708437 RepID=A0A9P6TF26_9BASI|nr:hypothetical protein CROQUDRAFT_416624 [Cronartium quercuum f. sp. fusiforme G11]
MANPQRPMMHSILAHMNSTRTTPSPSVRSTTATQIKVADPATSTNSTEIPVVSDDLDNAVSDAGTSQPSPALSSEQPQAPASVSPPKGGLADGHMPEIIGILCGVVVLGMVALGYSYSRYRKSRKSQSVLTADKRINPSPSLPGEQNDHQPPVDDTRRYHAIQLPSHRQPNSSSSLASETASCLSSERRPGTRYQAGTFENRAYATHHVQGNSEMFSRADFAYHRAWAQEHPSPTDVLTRQVGPRFSFHNQHRQNFDTPSPSPSLEHLVHQARFLPYGPTHYTCSFTPSQPNFPVVQGKPLHPGIPTKTSSAKINHSPLSLGVSSHNHGRLPPPNSSSARTINPQPFLSHLYPRQPSSASFQSPLRLSSQPIDMPSPEYKPKFTSSSRDHQQKEMAASVVTFAPTGQQASIQAPSCEVARNTKRPIVPKIQIPVHSKSSGIPTCSRGIPIPPILQPACPISMQRKRLESQKSSLSGSIDQFMSTSQRAIKDKMFLTTYNGTSPHREQASRSTDKVKTEAISDGNMKESSPLARPKDFQDSDKSPL